MNAQTKKAPTGLKILAWFLILSALVSIRSLVADESSMLFGAILSGQQHQALTLVYILLWLAVGIGLLRRATWAYTLFIWANAFMLASVAAQGIILLARGGGGEFPLWADLLASGFGALFIIALILWIRRYRSWFFPPAEAEKA